MIKITVLLLATLLFLPVHSSADEYRVDVTRKESNLYKVTGKDIYIFTKHCYEYVYYESALLRMNGYTGEIIFLDAVESCDVKGVYEKTDIDAGTYTVTITHEEDDWYSIMETGHYIKTFACYEYVYYTSAVLQIYGSGTGTLYVNGNEYMVEGLFARMRL